MTPPPLRTSSAAHVAFDEICAQLDIALTEMQHAETARKAAEREFDLAHGRFYDLRKAATSLAVILGLPKPVTPGELPSTDTGGTT